MKVDVRVEVVAAKSIDEASEVLRDMAITQVFAHDGVVFRFGLRVVVAVPGT